MGAVPLLFCDHFLELRKHICLNNLYTYNINLIVYLHV
jgi:hypothetical protein